METTNYQRVEQIIRVLQMRDETNEFAANGMKLTVPTIKSDQRVTLINELVKLLTTY